MTEPSDETEAERIGAELLTTCESPEDIVALVNVLQLMRDMERDEGVAP